jgi:hypothetical protein
MPSIQAEVEELNEQHADDPTILSEKVTALDRGAGVHTMMIEPSLIIGIAIIYGLAAGAEPATVGPAERWTPCRECMALASVSRPCEFLV